ncbi:hypothetical protein NMG60_11027560 [Bertholletia excelsa]
MPSQSLQHMSKPHTPPVTIVLAVLLLLVFFFIGFFTLFFCRCFFDNVRYIWNRWHGRAGTPIGLAPSAGGQGDDVLRLLPACYHVFHQECIDLWLGSHKTCPVCRRSVVSQEKSPERSPAPTMVEINENEPMDDAVSITFDDDRDSSGEAVLPSAASSTDQKQDTLNNREDKISRSHSTGHSIRRNRSKEDRFTLKLQEDLHVKIARGHHLSESCTTFGEFKSKETKGNGGFGEV